MRRRRTTPRLPPPTSWSAPQSHRRWRYWEMVRGLNSRAVKDRGGLRICCTQRRKSRRENYRFQSTHQFSCHSFRFSSGGLRRCRFASLCSPDTPIRATCPPRSIPGKAARGEAAVSKTSDVTPRNMFNLQFPRAAAERLAPRERSEAERSYRMRRTLTQRGPI